MAEQKQRRDESGLIRLRVNPADYRSDPILAPISAFSRTLQVVDNISPVSMDPARVAMCFQALRAKDHKYYFYVLSKLERNDKPIHIIVSDMRKFTKDKLLSVCNEGLNRLIAEGLLFRVPNRRSCYIVNPVYAWKGNRMDYLDTDSFPIITE